MSTNAAAGTYVPVTPDDDNDLPGGICRGLLCEAGGLADLHDENGTLREGVPLQTGYNPLKCSRILTSTAATNIWALYGG